MAKKSLNMIEKMMDPNIIDYYIINCAIPSIITIENRYQIDFGKPVTKMVSYGAALMTISVINALTGLLEIALLVYGTFIGNFESRILHFYSVSISNTLLRSLSKIWSVQALNANCFTIFQRFKHGLMTIEQNFAKKFVSLLCMFIITVV